MISSKGHCFFLQRGNACLSRGAAADLAKGDTRGEPNNYNVAFTNSAQTRSSPKRDRERILVNRLRCPKTKGVT